MLEEVGFCCDDGDGFSLLVLVLAPAPVCAQRMRMRAEGHVARGGRVRTVRSLRGIACIIGWSRIRVQ